jgi:hypothetical protein
MEFPAKRARLAPRELELLDLDDDALIMIIDKLDHKSKLQMMATCKRFEGLIGHTHQFFKNFKFRYDQEESKTKETQFLKMVRRRFGIVEVSSIIRMDCGYRNKSLKGPILEFLEKIGADILKIKFNKVFFLRSDFWKLLKAFPKIQELEMKDVEFSACLDENFEDFEFKELAKLDISGSTNLRVFDTVVPSSLKILRYTYNYMYNDGKRWNAEVLGKQKQLDYLRLFGCKIKDFKFDSENCHIKKLEIRCLRFLNGGAFEKFSDFMKVQKSVVELEFAISRKNVKTYDYAGFLTHLLALKTLKKVTIDCEYEDRFFTVLSKINLCNPTMDTLIIMNLPSGADLKLPSFQKLFPNVNNLKITWREFYGEYEHNIDFFGSFFVDLWPINSMKQIRKFEMDYVNDWMLAQLELPQLQALHVSQCVYDFGLGYQYLLFIFIYLLF